MKITSPFFIVFPDGTRHEYPSGSDVNLDRYRIVEIRGEKVEIEVEPTYLSELIEE